MRAPEGQRGCTDARPTASACVIAERLADEYAQNSGDLMGRGVRPPGGEFLRSHGEGSSSPWVSRPLETWRGYAAAGSPDVHTNLVFLSACATHTRTHTRHVTTDACPSPDGLPSIGVGSEPKLVPARAVLRGGAIGSHEAVPANMLTRAPHAPPHVPQLLTYMR